MSQRLSVVLVSVWPIPLSVFNTAPLPPRCVAELQKHIKTLDMQYDACNDAWATGEADKFTGEKLLDIIVACMYVLSL